MLITTLVHLYLLRQSYHNVQLNITREHITNTSERELPYCRNSWWGLRRCRRSHILTGSEGGAWSWGSSAYEGGNWSSRSCSCRGVGWRSTGWSSRSSSRCSAVAAGSTTTVRGGDGSSNYRGGGGGSSSCRAGDGRSRSCCAGDGRNNIYRAGGDGICSFTAGGDGIGDCTAAGGGSCIFTTGRNGRR